MRLLKFGGLLALVGSVSAELASNFDVTSEFAAANGCDSKCLDILRHANAYDHKQVGTDFDFGFYQTAQNFTGSKPGDLLKLEAADPAPLNIKAGTTVYRMQYTSLDLDGKTIVPSTGFIAFPYSPLGSCSKYRSIAFAHGTIGVYRGCAPSNGPSLFDYESWQLLLERGYAVIATDFAGLGNNETLHKYCSFPAQANDVYYSMVAARAAFGNILSRNWMSVGHSEGGGAVWKLAESSLLATESQQYLGTVALAPATHIIDMAVSGLLGSGGDDSDSGGFASYAPSLAVGIQRYQPTYNLTLLGPKMRERMAIADRAQVCATALAGLTLDLKLEDVVSLEGAVGDLGLLQEWQNKTAPSDGKAFAPLLVVQALNDTSILPDTTKEAVDRACKGGNTVHLSLYPGVEHSPLIPAAAPEWLNWIDARFSGQALATNCSIATRVPFGNGAHMKLPPEEDLKEEYGL
ncbi:prolyl aminopeptidase (secreted protein) [Cordyceps javanica]|uniref:Prolyl aminopeptidase (Secreted protein) n=1 Tax=Cordyceps javanica TaxID=43265 RepID=A0A545UP88_9HYPO|nr:prolyl aminopeptidase (secreted protein) [Cordyceps javanica]TQW02956.1 prolyl aminopeptidase (secreted protein) [Cordyceps javanica]